MMGDVAGIDRWRGGWIAAVLAGSAIEFMMFSNMSEATVRLSQCATVAIDMPIALAEQGRRAAEIELRQVLGSSARSVFTSPTRAAVAAASQNEATEINRRHGGPGISAQAYGLFASIRELRHELHGRGLHHWWETHPEAAFAIMNGGQPLASKRTAVGVGQRLQLLAYECGIAAADLVTAPDRVPVHDVLDAVAAAWSARRIARNEATVFGALGRDDEGFAVGIRI